MLRVTEDCFKIPDDFSFEDYVRYSFKVMQDELYAVTIRISPSWARFIGEKLWHQSQRIQKLIDGGIEISFKVAGLEEIQQWVLSMGPEAVVVEPEELRVLVWQSLKKTSEHYAGMTDDADAPEIGSDQIFAS
jgi:predicted DNA-binding transcriptional regulator YafY